MPINQTIWKIGKKIEQIQEIKLETEIELENVLQSNIEILNENWLIIGRQVLTKYNKYIDLLAIDTAGSLIILELKKDKTPRDVVAQAIDYASWIKSLKANEISDIFEYYNKKYLMLNKSLDEYFFEKFDSKLDEESLNSSHQIIIIATELDSSTERIISYLTESNVPVNILFFKVFSINNEKFISCAWYIDPYETSEIAIRRESKEPWNGEYYVSFGDGKERSWLDAVKYGFISGGGGAWYSRTLTQLKIGDRVWINIPHIGYVGIGKVTDTARKADKVFFNLNNKEFNIYDLPNNANYHKQYINDEDKAEYLVKIEWLKTVDASQAISEVGFFGNQNTVCKPTTNKWNHTIERLKNTWKII